MAAIADRIMRRVARGLHNIPWVNPILKRPASPDLGAVVDAVAHRDDVTIVPNGIAAANRLGLTNTVSARNDYLTDGSSRTMRVGKSVIRLRHAGRELMALKDCPAGDVGRAVHWLGSDLATYDVANTLRRRLSDDAKKDLARAASSTRWWPGWPTACWPTPDAAGEFRLHRPALGARR